MAEKTKRTNKKNKKKALLQAISHRAIFSNNKQVKIKKTWT
ncbi:MAG: hypothetical protein XE08_0277 [Parcubacteria bacterium 32_520]|nr:MAG: hypothetical protein XD75_0584 [Parcubacteria bacterium 33_209]KUK99025.1 MAG: hypothetical protein XE08_0277 [Parcubacteria bacterium 32_520]